MKYGKKIYLSIFWMVLGAALIGCEIAGLVSEVWSGMGGGFLIIGAWQVYRQLKYRRNEAYREKVDIAMQDERNRFIRGKAWAWAGYCFVLIEGILVVVFKLLGREDLMMMASYNVCGIVLIYWICWLVLRKKY